MRLGLYVVTGLAVNAPGTRSMLDALRQIERATLVKLLSAELRVRMGSVGVVVIGMLYTLLKFT